MPFLASIRSKVIDLLDPSCRECGGRGVIVDPDIVEFCRNHGLSLYQLSSTILANEPLHGPLGWLPGSAWIEAGMSDKAYYDYFSKVAHTQAVIACRTCNVQENSGTDMLAKANAIIRQCFREDGEDEYAEISEANPDL